MSQHVKDLKIPVFISLTEGDGFKYKGLLDFGDNKVDPNTGTILIRAVFENQAYELAPGRFVRVRLPFGDPHKGLLVSDRAILTDQGNKYVLVVNREAGDQQNVAEYRPVRLGMVHDGLRVVESGLKPGEWLITNGLQRARAGIKVVPHEGPMPGKKGRD